MFEDFRLRVFMTVAEKGSFTLAAKALGISQPAVSQNVAELEKNIGTELFARAKGAVTLTSAGQTFKEYASRILYWYSSAENLFGNSGELTVGQRIRISSDEFASGYILPDIISRILSSSPGLSFKITADSGNNGYDFRIWCKHHPAEPSLEEGASVVASVPAVAVVSDNMSNGNIDLKSLPENARLIVWQPYSSLLPPDLAAIVAVETASLVSIGEMVSHSNDLIGILPVSAAPSGLARLSSQLRDLDMDIHLMPSDNFRSSQLYSLIVNTLKDFL